MQTLMMYQVGGCAGHAVVVLHRPDSVLSLLDSAGEEAVYAAWLRAKLQASIDDPRPSIPHEQVMAGMREHIARIKARKTGSSMPRNNP